MANRGMLPKFRPATLGGRDGARPMIRPVGKPTAPPPPPSPPRRMSSGIRHPQAAPPPAIEGHADLQTPAFCDPPTMAAARQRIHEIARELPRERDRMEPRFDDETQARPVDGDSLIQAPPKYRAQPPAPMDVPYDSLPSLEAQQPYGYSEPPPPSSYGEPSTRARVGGYDNNNNYDNHNDHNDDGGYDEPREDHRGHHDQFGASHSEQYSEPPPAAFNRTAGYPGMNGGSPNSEDSGPRQRLRKNAVAVPQYDAAAYEANYGRREGSFQRRQQPQQSEDRYLPETEAPAPRRETSYQASQRERSYEPPPQQHQSFQRARKESGERVRDERDFEPVPETEIPQAPRVPQDMKVPAGFVMGVQPIRTPHSVAAAMPGYTHAPQHEAFPPLMQQPLRTPAMGIAPYGMPHQQQQQHAPGTMAASPRAMHGGHHAQPMHYPQQPQPHMHVRPQTTNAPVGHQLQMTEVEEAQQGSKVGRFAWFVFGAAFGIFFAFFATGFVPRLGKKEEITFPNPPAIPTQQQAAAAPPPVQVAPPPPQPIIQPQPQPPPQQFAPPPPPPVVAAAPPARLPAPPPTFAPAAPPPPQPYGVIAASPPAAAPAAPAPPPQKQAAAPAPPRGSRAGTIARRPASAPKAPAGDDDSPAPPPSKPKAEKSGGGDGIGDLLKDGLAP